MPIVQDVSPLYYHPAFHQSYSQPIVLRFIGVLANNRIMPDYRIVIMLELCSNIPYSRYIAQPLCKRISLDKGGCPDIVCYSVNCSPNHASGY